jgi:hypothetical protein
MVYLFKLVEHGQHQSTPVIRLVKYMLPRQADLSRRLHARLGILAVSGQEY